MMKEGIAPVCNYPIQTQIVHLELNSFYWKILLRSAMNLLAFILHVLHIVVDNASTGSLLVLISLIGRDC